MKKILGIFILLFTLSFNFSFADNSQVFLKVDDFENHVTKSKNYTYKYTTKTLNVYDKAGKKLLMSFPDKALNHPYTFFVNDSLAYYSKSDDSSMNMIVQINLKNKKSKVIKTFKSYARITQISGNNIYYITGEEANLRVLNINTNKDTFIAKNVREIQLGKNRIVYENDRENRQPVPLYSIGYDYKNPKQISKAALDYTLSGGKIYYVDCKLTNNPNSQYTGDSDVATIYVCNEDGSNKKALTGVINAYVEKITPNEIEYSTSNPTKYYRVNLKTKKTVEFTPNYNR
ncbi:hypothetical protein HMPREF0379_0380 [[Eubacterium] yurii subsp. margaretiae ATCC 43715]|nr:hypothetical protein HMPREF0379_0380 [[Eubacterium] yurii subsp. margaretiae ATCC 43715]